MPTPARPRTRRSVLPRGTVTFLFTDIEGSTRHAARLTGAALIIVAVFAGFAMGDYVGFQQMGFGVGVALLLDATLIRSIILPTAMRLLGSRTWYLPTRLQWLPRLQIEGRRSLVQVVASAAPSRAVGSSKEVSR